MRSETLKTTEVSFDRAKERLVLDLGTVAKNTCLQRYRYSRGQRCVQFDKDSIIVMSYSRLEMVRLYKIITT